MVLILFEGITMRKIYSSLDEAIRDLYGNERSVVQRRRISGGDINEACALTLDDGTNLFMKYNSPDAFLNLEAEAIGLTEIAATRTIGAARLLGLGKDRRDLYNLYQLLNHLNMFGGGYYSSVRSILKRYG